MEPNPLRTTLDALREQRKSAESRALKLRLELGQEEMRLIHIDGAIENLEVLLGDVPPESIGSVDVAESRPGGASVREVDFSNTPDPPVRRRVPSTDWVADTVNRLGRPADRDEIYEAFEEQWGIPDSWVSSPRNSFNNALGRAVERRMIIKLNDNVFAPRGFDPRGEPLELGGA